MDNVKDIRNKLVQEYLNENFVIDKTGVKTIEILAAQFIADENHIFRKPNEDYIKKELSWYLSQSLNVNDLEDTPKIWKQVADPSGFINSNYGWCIFNKANGLQYENCLAELKRNSFTRRGVMIYTRPSMWTDYNKNGMQDFMCTWGVNYHIRNNELISIVQQRSQDALFGFNNDFAWQLYVSEKLSNDLNVKRGNIIWNNGSLHVYERHFPLINEYYENKVKTN